MKENQWKNFWLACIAIILGLNLLVNLLIGIIATNFTNEIYSREEQLKINTYSYRWIKENCGQKKADLYYQYLKGNR